MAGAEIYPAHCLTPRNINEYIGYEPVRGTKTEIARVDADISPCDFYRDYIATRRPVVIRGHLREATWRGNLWTNKYLTEKAGDVDVIVERRGSDKDADFGLTAPKVDMKYSEFLKEVVKGNGRLYLTTQDLDRFESDLDEIGMPYSVMAEPLKSLSSDFPIQPELFGNLVPYQLSLWQGNAAEGTSSGLHHDFHDNLYILLRGRKRFRLFPPSAAPNMHTAGALAKIHHNGLVVYRNRPDDPIAHVRPDGVPMGFAARLRREEAENQLAEAEEKLEVVRAADLTVEDKKSQMEALHRVIAECEDQIDLAMEDMLTYDGTSDNDYGDSDCQIIGTSCAFEDITDDEAEPGEPRPKKLKVSPIIKENVCVSGASVQCHGDKQPDHFCQIKFPTDSNDPAVVFQGHPSVAERGYIFCDLHPGEMLYMPASWFHEVTSYTTTTEPDSSDSALDSGHLAFNYWMFPPDGSQFEQPYTDTFWQRRWESIQRGEVGVPLLDNDEVSCDNDNGSEHTRTERHTEAQTAKHNSDDDLDT